MSLLLDTHAFLWFLDGDARLSQPARAAIEDPTAQVFLSAASAWEIATKHRIGKLPGAAAIAADIAGAARANGFQELPITLAHAQLAGALQLENRDPFDRMLIAQALQERLRLVSNETGFDAAGVVRVW